MGGKTQETQTSSSTTPNGLSQLQDIYARAQSAASTPYTPYGGQLTAGLNDTQTAGIAGANANANLAQPYYATAANYATQGAAGIDPATVQKYMNPYTQSVIDATQRNFQESNGQQQQQVIGNAALKGALGGNRVGVAQAELARQQKLAQDPVIAGLNQSNYTQALQAAQGDRTAAQTGASQFAGLGTGAQTAALQGVQGQLTAGGVQQGTEQADLTAQYNQYLQQQAFPYQQAQFLAGIGLPAASAMGSSTTGTTTSPGPSILGQIAGLGTAALGAFGNPFSGMFGGGSSSGVGNYGQSSNATGYGAGTGGLSFPMFADGGAVRGSFLDYPGYIPKPSASSPRKAGGGGVSFDDRFSGSPFSASGDEIVISDPGLQQVDPKAVQAWRDGVDNPNPAVVADAAASMPAVGASPMTAAASLKLGGGSGAVNLPPQITGPSEDSDLPASAMAFDGAAPASPFRGNAAPQQTPEPATAPGQFSDKTRQTLIAAGLGMLASKSPFAGVALGEGGLHGLKAYSQMTAAEKEAADKAVAQKQNQQRIDQEAKRIAQSAEQFGKTHGLQREKFDYEKNNQEKAVQYLGPAADGSGSVMMDKKSGRIYVEPVSVAGGKPSPIQAATIKADVNKVGEYAKAADAAREGIATLDNIDALRKDAYTGPVAGRIASAVGHPATAALESQTDSLALSIAQKMKGSLSDKDIAFVKAQVPGLKQVGAAGESVSGMLRGAFERSAQKADFFRDWLEVNGSLKDANKAWDRYTNENPLTVEDKKAVGGRKFNPDFNRDYSRYMTPKGNAPAATSALPQIPSGVPAGSAYSPSRKMWRSPDGQIFDASGNPVQG